MQICLKPSLNIVIINLHEVASEDVMSVLDAVFKCFIKTIKIGLI